MKNLKKFSEINENDGADEKAFDAEFSLHVEYYEALAKVVDTYKSKLNRGVLVGGVECLFDEMKDNDFVSGD